MGIVAAPHEPVDADLLAGGGVGRAGLADAHVAALREVLGGRVVQLLASL